MQRGGSSAETRAFKVWLYFSPGAVCGRNEQRTHIYQRAGLCSLNQMSSFFSNVDISESLVLLHLCGSVSPGKWGWRWDSLHMRSVRQRPMHTACVDTTGEPNMCSWPWLPPSAPGIFMALLNSRPLSRGRGCLLEGMAGSFLGMSC